MHVREAQQSDKEQFVNLAEIFFVTSPIQKIVDFDRDGFADSFDMMLNHDDSGLWVAVVGDKIIGIAGAVFMNMYFAPTKTAVQEMFWFVLDKYRNTKAGFELHKAIEAWGKIKGACAIYMVALCDNRFTKTRKYYTRKGHEQMETYFMKGLHNGN